MLISDKNKFIFIHIPKNAGSSIAKTLLPHATSLWIYGINKISDKLQLPKVAAWNAQPFDSHVKAYELVDALGQERFDSYFSFAVVRNPWDWQVSFYSYILRQTRHFQHEIVKSLGSFDSYVRWRCEYDVQLQKEYICSPQDDILVDYVARFENLVHDFGEVCDAIGVSASLRKVNVSNTKPYQSFYTDETRGLVAEAFAPDIEFFGYTFEPQRDKPQHEDTRSRVRAPSSVAG